MSTPLGQPTGGNTSQLIEDHHAVFERGGTWTLYDGDGEKVGTIPGHFRESDLNMIVRHRVDEYRRGVESGQAGVAEKVRRTIAEYLNP